MRPQVASLVASDQYSRVSCGKPPKPQPFQRDLPQFMFRPAIEEIEMADSWLADRLGRNSEMRPWAVAEIPKQPFHREIMNYAAYSEAYFGEQSLHGKVAQVRGGECLRCPGSQANPRDTGKANESRRDLSPARYSWLFIPFV